MIYFLDSNTCIKYLNGWSEPIRRRIGSLRPDNLAICTVVKAELFFGAWKSARPGENLSKLHRFFERFPSPPFDDAAAEAYGRIRAGLERSGAPIGPNDLLIAAITLSQAGILVTHNVREFERIEGLSLEDWE